MIKPLNEILDESLFEISKYQKKEKLQIKTNRPWLDHQGGLLLQSILLICGASFSGKTTESESLKDDIMNININPDAKDYVWLSNRFEMTALATTLRDLRKVFKKSFKDILSKPFNEDEQDILLHYLDSKKDGRFFVNDTPYDPNNLLNLLESFLEEHKDKKAVFIDIDHMALIKADSEKKKGSIDLVVEGLNELKNKYKNVIFILLTQLNRDILRRIEPKSNNFAIQRSDIYQSDTMYHIADVIYGLQNPYFFKIEEYRVINPTKYEHLSHRFTPPIARSGKVSLYTEGCIFVEVLKDRFADFDFIDLYTIEINSFKKPAAVEQKMITPIFDNKLPPF